MPTEETALPKLNDAQIRALNQILVDAICFKNAARTETVLRKGADANTTVSITPIVAGAKARVVPLAHYAYMHYSAEVVKVLVGGGMKIDAPDENGNTILMLAAQAKDPSAPQIATLTALGADPLKANNTSGTALLDAFGIAAGKPDREKIIDILLERIPDRVVRPQDTASAQQEAKPDFNIATLPMTLDKAIPPIKSISFSEKPPSPQLQGDTP